jgi:hypothetical protein
MSNIVSTVRGESLEGVPSALAEQVVPAGIGDEVNLVVGCLLGEERPPCGKVIQAKGVCNRQATVEEQRVIRGWS